MATTATHSHFGPRIWLAGPRVMSMSAASLRQRHYPTVMARRADALLKHVRARAWQRISAGRGAKGHRYYDWAFVRLDPGQRDPSDPGSAGC